MNRIRVKNDGNKISIAIQGDFTFDLNREFREAYQSCPASAQFEVDLRQADYMDSAGLGMLLQLRDYAGGDSARIAITGANETIRSVLEVANFHKLFTIR